MFYKFLLIIISIFFIWQLFVYFRANPGAFSKVNLNRSVFTLGILTLLLIGFVALLVFIVRH
ncbi:MAG: hypothetical protein ACD_21C00056G0001 [uncultured bacterium]|nr:MAG: hypothetical protein ACD_21C00056G0001 [uncultured bacterium]